MKKKEAGINEIELLVNEYSVSGNSARRMIELIEKYSFTSMSLELALYNLSKNPHIKSDPAYTELRLSILEELITIKNPIINNMLKSSNHE